MAWAAAMHYNTPETWQFVDGDEIFSVELDPTIAHSRESSGSTIASENSPVTPSFSSRNGHSRIPSSSSSTSTPPPHAEPLESSNVYKKQFPALPDVAEEPLEREGQPENAQFFESPPISPVGFFNPLKDEFYEPHCSSRVSSPPVYRTYDQFFTGLETEDDHFRKRRRSNEAASFNRFAARIASGLPSISRASSRARKRASATIAELRSGAVSPAVLSRSHSRASSYHRPSWELEMDHVPDKQIASQIETIEEDDLRTSGYSIIDEPDPADDVCLHPRDSPPRASTPLLPTLLDKAPPAPPIESPLQSPTVASPSRQQSFSNTPAGTPHLSGMASPTLSTKPSLTSLRRSRAASVAHPVPVPSAEIPHMWIADANDPWAEKLGHANFQITPEPYVPDQCNGETCRQLLADWEKARAEFSKHLARTETHFGATSRIYRLTEEKWAELDAKWKLNHTLAVRKAAEIGTAPLELAEAEPAPVMKIPQVDDSLKFPQLGDGDIVGPMTKNPAIPKRRASKREQFLKKFGGLTFTSGFLNKSTSVART